MARSNIRAFTLIELLVVLAIIALLAAILFPVFARARENARRSSCQSNLKQLSLGVIQYAQDYDERMPLWCLDQNGTVGCQNTTGDVGWTELIEPYTKSNQILQCPSEPDRQGTGPKASNWSDYFINPYASQSVTSTIGYIPRHMATIEFPALLVVLGDAGDWAIGASDSTSYVGSAGCNTGANPALLPRNTTRPWASGAILHLEGLNVAFADGHVKWYKGAQDDGYCNAGRSASYYYSPQIYNQVLTGSTTPRKSEVPSFSP